MGGLALTNYKLYCQATALTRVADWKYAMDSKLWVHLESVLADTDLLVVPWLPRSSRGLASSTSPLTISALSIWDSLHSCYSWKYNSLMMPLNHI